MSIHVKTAAGWTEVDPKSGGVYVKTASGWEELDAVRSVAKEKVKEAVKSRKKTKK